MILATNKLEMDAEWGAILGAFSAAMLVYSCLLLVSDLSTNFFFAWGAILLAVVSLRITYISRTDIIARITFYPSLIIYLIVVVFSSKIDPEEMVSFIFISGVELTLLKKFTN